MATAGRELIPVPLNLESSNLEFAETTSVTLEWRLSGLKQVFDSTRGDAKSKCIKSAIFGDADALWECIWYPNAGAPPGTSQPPSSTLTGPNPPGAQQPPNLQMPGTNGHSLPPIQSGAGGSSSAGGGEFSSFYLSAVPTQEEKDAGVKNRWTRRGLYAFRFEIRTPNKGTTMVSKEAYNHAFSSKTVNWGWQSFGRRDNIFYNAPPAVRQSDSFIVVCTVSAGATPPAAAWLNLPPPSTAKTADLGVSPSAFDAGGCGWKGSAGALRGLGGGNGAMAAQRQLVPKDLVDAVGWLFNDELYSDVEFVIPSRKRLDDAGKATKAKTPSQTGRDTFEDHDGSDLNGGNAMTSTDAAGGSFSASSPPGPTAFAVKQTPSFDMVISPETEVAEAPITASHRRDSQSRARRERRRARRIWANKRILRRSEYFYTILDGGFAESAADEDLMMRGDRSGADEDLEPMLEDSDIEEEALSDNDSDDSLGDDGESSEDELMITPSNRRTSGTLGAAKIDSASHGRCGPEKTKLVIRDSAYRTWQALLYWLYTDTITFAPLTSSFVGKSTSLGRQDMAGSSASISSLTGGASAALPSGQAATRARRKWCNQWASERSARSPKPCSAKAIYRLADKFNLEPLKQRAYAHIIANMTVQNVPHEVFSSFSATYEQVRKVQVSFFLAHWNEIKSSPAMVNIWQAIRLGRHQGFEEVWPHIVSNLEFRSTDSVAPGSEAL